jgi:cytosine/adenosine deaminase-related metal-dependent hydrolase
MFHFSAQYILTNRDHPLKRAVVTVEDDGTILKIEETGGNLREKADVEFHNGIIIPGFVNCHSHLELSHLKGFISPGEGLGEFIKQIRSLREADENITVSSFLSADQEMFRTGTVLCADICNTSMTFEIKTKSHIRYINLIELFGINSSGAERRLTEIRKILNLSRESEIESWLVPHSAYSLSMKLFRLLKQETLANRISSVHFMESEDEGKFLHGKHGDIYNSYLKSGLLTDRADTVSDHISAVLKEITPSGNLILVHNTFVDRSTIREIKKRNRVFWCLCPNSNLYISNSLPPLDLLTGEDCEIVIGTDSLASNNQLSVLEELKTIQKAYPGTRLEDLVRWATLNGAKALGEDLKFGSLEPGKKPGLLLIRNADLVNLKLLPDSSVTRLI